MSSSDSTSYRDLIFEKVETYRYALSIFCLLLIPAIILLQQHYVIDLIGGVAVAVLAVAMVSEEMVWERRMLG